MNQFKAAGWGPLPEELKGFPKMSVSAIMEIWESPAHYESTYILKEGEETEAMRLGTAVHMALLEPERFAATYCAEYSGTIPPYVLTTNKDLQEELRLRQLKTSGTKTELFDRLNSHLIEKSERAHPDKAMFQDYDYWVNEMADGKEILKNRDWKACQRIVQRVNANKRLKTMISGGEPEKLGWAIHERTGTVITFKADYVKIFDKTYGGLEGVVTDVKKVQSVKKRKFESSIWDNGLFIQASVYVDIMEFIYKKKMGFMWLAAEEKAPYIAMGYPADFGLLEAGRNEYNKMLDLFEECRKNNHWPTYSEDLVNVTLPAYAWSQLETKDNEYAQV